MKHTFHVPGVSSTETNENYFGCPFTSGIFNLITAMVTDDCEVIHYCNHGSDTPATDIFVTDPGFLQVLGTEHNTQYHSSYKSEHWERVRRDFSIACAAHIRKYVKEGDFVLLPSDGVQDVVSFLQDIPGIKFVETNIGYPDPVAEFRIFESHTWRASWRARAERTLDIYKTLTHNHEHRKSHDDAHGHSHGQSDPPPMFYNANIMVPVVEPRRVLDTVIFPIVDVANLVSKEKSRDDYFLYLGRIIQSKGIKDAIELTEILEKKLVVAGPGRFEDEFKDFDEGLPKHVEFIGMANKDKRDSLLSRASCLLALTRYSEPYGYIVPEAGAFECPVITSDTGGFTETVTEGVNGFTGGCMAEWVEKAGMIDSLDPAAIRKHAENRFSAEALYPKYKAFWRRIDGYFDNDKNETFTY